MGCFDLQSVILIGYVAANLLTTIGVVVLAVIALRKRGGRND